MAAKRHRSKSAAPPSPSQPPRGIVARQAARIAELDDQLQQALDANGLIVKERSEALGKVEDYKRSLADSQAGHALTRNELAQAKTTIASQARLIGELEQFRFYTKQSDLRRSVEQNGASFRLDTAAGEAVS